MNRSHIRRTLIGFSLVALLAGCPGHPFVRGDRAVFKLTAADAEVYFQVIDQRDQAAKTFRIARQSPLLYEYGDDQFIPRRTYVVASHFAAAFPRTPPDARLVIERLELKNFMPRPYAEGKPEEWMGAVAALLLEALRTSEKNYIACRLTGSFAQTRFDVTQDVPYDEGPGTEEMSRAVNAAMFAAIVKAIAQVRPAGTTRE
jgi:hypothetical protein